MLLCAALIGPEAARWVGLDVGLILQNSTGVMQRRAEVIFGSLRQKRRYITEGKNTDSALLKDS